MRGAAAARISVSSSVNDSTRTATIRSTMASRADGRQAVRCQAQDRQASIRGIRAARHQTELSAF